MTEYLLVLFEGGASGEDRDNVGTQHGGMLFLLLLQRYFLHFNTSIVEKCI
jgi:hypothetical protein